MKLREITLLNGTFDVSDNVPTTVEDMKAIGIGEQDVVDSAVDDLTYRNKLPRVYKSASKALAGAGFARVAIDQRKRKDGTLIDVVENPMDHLRAYLTGRKGETTKSGFVLAETPAPDEAEHATRKTQLGEWIQKAMTDEPLFVQGERSGSVGKVSTAFMEQANNYIAKGEDKVEKVAAAIEAEVEGYTVGRDADGKITPESLGRALTVFGNDAKKKAEAANKAKLEALE